ncbi:MAG: cyclodeaminase/cyclohydrolase family protein [Pseudomonadales bacterium]|nr:cyclodeaminase/cyclohydrolase family protein [Pseudomonadales bacterium]
MQNQSLSDFLQSLGSSSATPGGGAVAAISGAQASGLIAMVCNLTRPKDDEIKTLIDAIKQRAEHATTEFLNLGEADMTGFNEVMRTYKLPKKTADDRLIAKNALQTALKAAALPPLKTLQLASSLIPDLKLLYTHANPNLITDVGIAAILIPATIQAAEMNILINLKSLTDKHFNRDSMETIQAAKQFMPELSTIAAKITANLASDIK